MRPYPRTGRFRASLAAGLFSTLLPAVVLAAADEIPRLTFAQLVDSIRAESEVVREFYERDARGIPRRWLKRIKASLRSIGPFFNTARMRMRRKLCAERPP